MIDLSEIYKEMRTSIKNRFDNDLSVIQARTTGVKPKGLYATVDVVGVTNSNSNLTNKYLEEEGEDGDEVLLYKYETHKDITISISFRNGDPENFVDQMRVLTMCNNMVKAFEEGNFLNDLYDRLGATVKSVSGVRQTSEAFPTGYGNIALFTVVISMNDVTQEEVDYFERVEIDFNFNN